jgi:hypothetical protein
MFNQCCCCYSKPILDVADNKFAESAAVLMLRGTTALVYSLINSSLYTGTVQRW